MTEMSEDPYRAPDWRNPLEWIAHPLASLIMLPIILIGHMLAGLLNGCYVWFWNVRNSSSVHGSWRPDAIGETGHKPPSTRKNCADCRHFVAENYRCLRPVDAITGESFPVPWRQGSAYNQRSYSLLSAILENKCGRSARWFEPKPQQKER